MKEAYCYLSIELDGDLKVENPISELARLLRVSADEVERWSENTDLDETYVIREKRKRLGQLDIHISDNKR